MSQTICDVCRSRSFHLHAVDRVVFTGDLGSQLIVALTHEAAEVPLWVQSVPTRRTVVAVARDPDRPSGQAGGAAAEGAPVITVEAFRRAMREANPSPRTAVRRKPAPRSARDFRGKRVLIVGSSPRAKERITAWGGRVMTNLKEDQDICVFDPSETTSVRVELAKALGMPCLSARDVLKL